MILKTLVPKQPTSLDILDIFRDQHRHQCSTDPEADPEIELSLDSTIQQWRSACDLVDWISLAKALNDQWELDIPLAAWKEVLTPPRSRRLEGVCQLISDHAKIERVIAPAIFGKPCQAAGFFFAIRELLHRDGADVSELTPSTPIAQYAVDHYRTFAGSISQLAPGKLPAIKIDHPEYDRASTCLVLSAFCLAISLALIHWHPFLWILPFIAISVCWLWTNYTARCIKPSAVTFGNLRTIRDVCRVLAAR